MIALLQSQVLYLINKHDPYFKYEPEAKHHHRMVGKQLGSGYKDRT